VLARLERERRPPAAIDDSVEATIEKVEVNHSIDRAVVTARMDYPTYGVHAFHVTREVAALYLPLVGHRVRVTRRMELVP
jgi:hypothetical protein